MMLYLYPFLDRVIVEFRHDTDKKLKPGSWQWGLRNYAWKTVWPFFSNLMWFLPVKWLRYWIINQANRLTGVIQTQARPRSGFEPGRPDHPLFRDGGLRVLHLLDLGLPAA